MASQPVRLRRYVVGGSGARAFEQGVLDEVAYAVEWGRFVPRTAPHPNAKGDRAQAWHVFRQNGQTIRKPGCLNVIDHCWRKKFGGNGPGCLHRNTRTEGGKITRFYAENWLAKRRLCLTARLRWSRMGAIQAGEGLPCPLAGFVNFAAQASDKRSGESNKRSTQFIR